MGRIARVKRYRSYYAGLLKAGAVAFLSRAAAKCRVRGSRAGELRGNSERTLKRFDERYLSRSEKHILHSSNHSLEMIRNFWIFPYLQFISNYCCSVFQKSSALYVISPAIPRMIASGRKARNYFGDVLTARIAVGAVPRYHGIETR